MTVAINDIDTARQRLAPVLKLTPLQHSATLSRMLEAEVLIKPENLQKTGSFKIRGAYNRVMALTPEQARHGVVAASAGNHGQALSYAATAAGVKATIVMPETAAIAKVEATRSYGQTVVLRGINYQEARRAADLLCHETGATFIDAYDDPWVIAGQGTVGLEIAQEGADVVVVPVGGGGLIAGVAVALAARAPQTMIIGVEAAGSQQLSTSLRRGEPSAIDRPVETIADGLATGNLGVLPYELIRARVHDVVSIDDFEIGEAVLLLLERMKLLAEGAGAAALAGALKRKDLLKGKRVVLLISGGNIDINLLDRIIGHGLVKAGRLYRFHVTLPDRPVELSRVLALIGGLGANVRTIDHDRMQRGVALGAALVELELETRGSDHIELIRRKLQRHGYRIEDEG
ncbi:MAG TPA: threonine ammonia-lyase [Candidatus Binataceae bacterium]|jgi:threonine dehydratase|nr:threonine ammonia-lyase [Candidatus Binataceae bacterium]